MLTHEFPPMRGGISRYAVELATAATRLGHEVTVMAPCAGHPDTQFDTQAYEFCVQRYAGEIYSARHFPSTLSRILRLGRVRNFDIVHAIDRPHVYALSFMNHFRRQPYMATVYGTELRGIASTRHSRWLRLRPVFAGCIRVCAISEFTRKLLLEECPDVAAEQIQVTPLAVSPFWFERASTGSKVRERLGIPYDRKLILTVSRLDERKGHREVLASLRRLPRQLQTQIAYVIVGSCLDSPYGIDLRQLAESSTVSVIMTGALPDEDVRSLYAEATVFSMPGVPHPIKVEGFGLVYLEAAAQGLPSIGTNVGGVPEVIRHNETGVIIPADSPAALDAALTKMLEDHSFRDQLGANAREWASRFTWERCAEATYGGII